MKSKFFSILQKIGTSLMLPVSVLPAAGLLFRLGQPDLLGNYGEVFQYMGTAGDAIFNNLPIIFAIGVAIGFTNGEGTAALSAVVGELILESIIEKYSYISQTTIYMGVFGGILIGLTTGFLYNRYHNISLPKSLGFFSGKRFIPIITSIAALCISVICIYIWPNIQIVIDIFANWASNSPFGPAFYAAGKRLLIPVGLHHVYYPAFLYQFGSYVVGGITYVGDFARYFHGDPQAGIFMAAEYPILMFGLPGAALAIIASSKKENRKKVSGVMLSAALVSFLTGITEPIEFSFIFVAPYLFVFHVVAAFFSGIITNVLNIRLGYTFSASFIDYILGYNYSQHPFLLWIVGLAFFILYFVVFYFTIKLKNIQTIGRTSLTTEEDAAVDNINITKTYSRAEKILNAIGGKENIENIDACITRLRLTLKDSNRFKKEPLIKLGASGIFEASNNFQIVFGTDAQLIKDEIVNILRLDNPVYDKVLNSTVDDNDIKFFAPITGNIIPLDKVPDEVFSKGILGQGFALAPLDNKVYSPISGKITMIFPTKHAIVIKTEENLDALIHVGIDSVLSEGCGFNCYVNNGDAINSGDLLISFDESIVLSKATSLISPIIITNLPDNMYLQVEYGEKKAMELAALVVKK